MKILITGIDGFIGSALAGKLIAHGHQVVGLSDGIGFLSGDKPRIYITGAKSGASKPAPYEFHRVEITDRDAVFSVFCREKPDITIHLAAMAHADVGPEKEALVRRVNVDGSLNVAKAAEVYGGGKVLFFSSVKVLAETTGPEGIDEDSEPEPGGVYAMLKREVEVELLKQTNEGRLAATIVRPAAVIGPGDSKGNYAKMARALKAGFFPLIDGGSAKRSVVFLERLAERVRVMIEKGVEPGGVFVLSDGAFEVREIVDAMRFSLGFAWCPSVSGKAIEKAAVIADSLFSTTLSGSGAMARILTRLTADFIVNAHRYDERYGPLPQINLVKEMRRVFENN